MIRSKIDNEPREFDLVREKEHIEKVMERINKNFDNFFTNMYIDPDVQKLREQLHAKALKKDQTKDLKNICNKGIKDFQKESERYKSFFNQDSFQNFWDYDIKAFKSSLKKECPVILHSMHSKLESMKVWKERFNYTNSEELLETFQNLLSFADDYANDVDIVHYSKIDQWQDFGFELIDEKEYGVLGVIGMGIKSITLFHIYPHIFPRRGRRSLLGLFF